MLVEVRGPNQGERDKVGFAAADAQSEREDEGGGKGEGVSGEGREENGQRVWGDRWRA